MLLPEEAGVWPESEDIARHEGYIKARWLLPGEEPKDKSVRFKHHERSRETS
jgi:hypothetical protein